MINNFQGIDSYTLFKYNNWSGLLIFWLALIIGHDCIEIVHEGFFWISNSYILPPIVSISPSCFIFIVGSWHHHELHAWSKYSTQQINLTWQCRPLAKLEVGQLKADFIPVELHTLEKHECMKEISTFKTLDLFCDWRSIYRASAT